MVGLVSEVHQDHPTAATPQKHQKKQQQWKNKEEISGVKLLLVLLVYNKDKDYKQQKHQEQQYKHQKKDKQKGLLCLVCCKVWKKTWRKLKNKLVVVCSCGRSGLGFGSCCCPAYSSGQGRRSLTGDLLLCSPFIAPTRRDKTPGASMLCCGRRKDQGRDIPPNAEPAASPRRLQLGQIASTLPPGAGGGRLGGPGGGGGVGGRDLPPMVLQPDFRKVSGISTEIFRQLESVENDHDATTAAALGAVERRGEMLVRMLDPRQFSRPVQEAVRKFLSMQDGLHSVHFVEIVKRPGQTLGLYIREGNGVDRYDGVFISRIAVESAVFNSGCLGVGDEILAVNLVDVTHMSLDDVVILMSIPRRLVLTIRQRKGRSSGGMGSGMMMGSSSSMLRSESKLPPVVVIKKDLEDDGYDESTDENGHLMSQLGPGPYHHHLQQQQHSFGRSSSAAAQVHHTLSHPGGYPMGGGINGGGRGRSPQYQTTQGQRIFGAQPLAGGRQVLTPLQQAHQHLQQQSGGYQSIHSLPRHSASSSAYQPHYANVPLQQQLPDVTDYSSRGIPRHDDHFRLEAPQPPIRRNQFGESFYDRQESLQNLQQQPPRPSSQQGMYAPYEWYRGGGGGGDGSERLDDQNTSIISRRAGVGVVESASTASISYQPPPPVITEQPRSSIGPQHFQPFDRAYPKTLESLAEKVHTFYTGPRAPRSHHGQNGSSRVRMPRTGSDHRLSGSRGGEPQWYGSMPRQRPGQQDFFGRGGLAPGGAPGGGGGGLPPSARYSAGLSARLGVPSSRRSNKGPVDYASDSEAMGGGYGPSIRSGGGGAGLSLPASTRRSLGLTNGRSNSLPRDLIRGGRAGGGGGGRKHNVRFDKRGVPDLTSSLAGRRALLLASGMDSQDESDGALSAPEMPLTPRRERGGVGITSSSSPLTVFTSAEYRAWLTRAPSTSAIYERLKTNRDFDLLQTQKAAKLTYSAENLNLLDRARTRTERQLKLLTESLERENLSNLAQWEAQQRQQEQQRPYYSYRTHLLTGGDSTLARALASGRSPSTSSALSALAAMGGAGGGIMSPGGTGGGGGGLKESLSSDPLRRLVGISPSRSRDLLSSLQPSSSSNLKSPGGIMLKSATLSSADGRRSPSASLLHRISAEKDESLLRKEILSRSLLGRDLLSRESLKDDLLGLEDKSEKIAARLSSVGMGGGVGSGGAGGIPPGGALLSGRHVGGGVGVGGVISSASVVSGPGGLISPGGGIVPPGSTTPTGTGTGGGGSIASTGTGDSRLKLLTINPSEFSRYKIERPSSSADNRDGGSLGRSSSEGPGGGHPGHSGILRVHLLAGRALRSTVKTTDASVRTRDLYCVLECDRVHKARTVVCTGDQNFDWDETFDLDIVNNKELDFLIYSWDPQLRHRLCYKGSVNLVHVLSETRSNSSSEFHQLAIKVEPRGTLYVKLKHTGPHEAFKREGKSFGLFGANLASIVMKEDSGLNVPLIVQRCIEEIERRGLDIIGLYRLCGSATKKQMLREAFERSPRSVDLSAENVPDINVITGVLKDYLRELPEPLLTKCLYQMLVDALGVCLPDDPEGNARLLFSIIECLPKPNRCTLLLILEHLSLVCSLSDRNKMGPVQLAQCFGPILMVHFEPSTDSIDFCPPIKVLQYLLETWPAKSVTLLQTVRAAGAVEAARKGPSLLLGGKQGQGLSSTGGRHHQMGQQQQRSSSSTTSSPVAASILLSRRTGSTGSNNTNSSHPHLPLSPSKHHQQQHQHHQPSPGSLSESSPSPTTNNSRIAPILSSSSHHPGASSAPPATTLTPSTTSSSLTSVTTTPNSLTPVSSTAKSVTPATTSSNYSLTSEFSTTSVTSPTPSHHYQQQQQPPHPQQQQQQPNNNHANTHQNLFNTSSSSLGQVPPSNNSNNANGFSSQPPLVTSSQKVPEEDDEDEEEERGDDVFATVSVRNRASVFEGSGSANGGVGGGAISNGSDHQMTPQSFYAREILHQIQQQENAAASLQQSHNQTSQQQHPGGVPPSPFMGRKMMGLGGGPVGAAGGGPIVPLPGRAERADSFEDGSTTTSSNSSNNSISSKRRLPSIPQQQQQPQIHSSNIFERQDSHPEFATVGPGYGGSSSSNNKGHDIMSSSSSGRVTGESSSTTEEILKRLEGEIAQEETNLMNIRMELSSSSSQQQQQPSSQSSMSSGSLQQQYGGPPPPYSVSASSNNEPLYATSTKGPNNNKPIPPPPPPKPSPGTRQRLSSSTSDDETFLAGGENGGGVSPASRPRSNGHHHGGGMEPNGGGGSGTSSGGSSTTTPTTIQSQIGSNAKGSSPSGSGGTPLGTPPPVPPRLDRRPSQPSPTSSPPAMPPPVPPRLGRAAPVRTPSLDSREAFEVDCYTIKEENGEEDFLT